jgi:putative heme-binding domain-containing protein
VFYPFATTLVAALLCVADGPMSLQDALANEDPAALARAVRTSGDAGRGAVVFYQKHLACTTCHGDVGNDSPTLGPDLAKLGQAVTDAYLIESILDPSRTIKAGFEPVTIATVDGRTLSGLLVENRPERVVLRDPAQGGKLVTVTGAEVESRKVGGASVMPPALANALGSRQEFLDLVRYLRDVADGGPARARALRPDPSRLVLPPLPDFERSIDHAGLIAGLRPANLKSGEAIYERVCATCHGTIDRPGSMPTSLRFGSGRFKNGSDPYALYRTLTDGFSQMPAQRWMVPRQKYDVIHYIREEFLRKDNPSQYAKVDRPYLATLPKGTSQGPAPVVSESWKDMNYGHSLMATVEVAPGNFAYKGVCVRLDPGPGGVSKGQVWSVYDHDTMTLEAAWTGRDFIDWRGINFNGQHAIHPTITGKALFANNPGPGWANPKTGQFDDPRSKGRDGRPYGPLPREWLRYRGLYHHGDRAILAYTVGDAEVLELPELETDPGHPEVPVIARTFEVEPHAGELRVRVAPAGLLATIVGEGADLEAKVGETLLSFPASRGTTRIKVLTCSSAISTRVLTAYAAGGSPRPEPLDPLTRGGPSRWPQVLKTSLIKGRDDGPFAVDILTHPASNPWSGRMRLSGLDFLPGGKSLAVCDWDGDVWRVDGIDDPAGALTWRRIASGLFQPLGLKVVNGAIYVACRDQIAILRDFNGDGETDFVECFNSDHEVTEHFHEFAMDLQTDSAGNFYYAKGARHALKALVPQHGTLLRVSPDGARTDILATGFRAPNGVLVNPDGTFFLTDQEGFWTPKNRINHVQVGRFYGNMWGYHDVTDPSDAAMEPPVVWITNAVDRSPSEIVRVPSKQWGPLEGALLSLSYGYGKVFIVPHEAVHGRMQGGVSPLPIPQFPTGVMRGLFHPVDGSLYTCGMFAWAGTQEQPGGLYRIRPTGKPSYLPIGLHARHDEMAITFTDALDPATAADPTRFNVKVWSLRRSERYGSNHIGERPLTVRASRLAVDGKSVVLDIPDIAPTQGMEIRYSLKGRDGSTVVGTIDNTIHALGDGGLVNVP